MKSGGKKYKLLFLMEETISNRYTVYKNKEILFHLKTQKKLVIFWKNMKINAR